MTDSFQTAEACQTRQWTVSLGDPTGCILPVHPHLLPCTTGLFLRPQTVSRVTPSCFPLASVRCWPPESKIQVIWTSNFYHPILFASFSCWSLWGSRARRLHSCQLLCGCPWRQETPTRLQNRLGMWSAVNVPMSKSGPWDWHPYQTEETTGQVWFSTKGRWFTRVDTMGPEKQKLFLRLSWTAAPTAGAQHLCLFSLQCSHIFAGRLRNWLYWLRPG